MINRENLVKIGRAGGKTSNRETPDQIGRVGISAINVRVNLDNSFFVDARKAYFFYLLHYIRCERHLDILNPQQLTFQRKFLRK